MSYTIQTNLGIDNQTIISYNNYLTHKVIINENGEKVLQTLEGREVIILGNKKWNKSQLLRKVIKVLADIEEEIRKANNVLEITYGISRGFCQPKINPAELEVGIFKVPHYSFQTNVFEFYILHKREKIISSFYFMLKDYNNIQTLPQYRSLVEEFNFNQNVSSWNTHSNRKKLFADIENDKYLNSLNTK